MSHEESPPTLRSEMFFWHELSSGGDGTGKVYKVALQIYLKLMLDSRKG
jgi:hypothetical protein